MASMHAVELFDPGPDPTLALREVDRDLPAPSSGQVRLRITASAVCRTDLQLTTGDLPAHLLPIVPGHQVVGVIDAIGPDVTGWTLGDRAGLVWLARACGECRFCLRDRENLCLHAEFTGWDVDGGYADYVLADAAFAHPLAVLPHDFTDAAVAPLLCGGVIGYRSLRVAGVGPDSAGMRLGFYGFGASATIAMQVAQHWGVECYAITRSAVEVQRAQDLGAVWAGDYEAKVPVPLDAAITFAPVWPVVEQALRDTDRGACVAINAIHLDGRAQLNYDDLWWERELRSVANVTRQDVREFLSWVGPANVTTWYEELPLSEAATALTRVAAGDVHGAFVLRP